MNEEIPAAPGADKPHDPAAAVAQGSLDGPRGPAAVVPQVTFDGPRGPAAVVPQVAFDGPRGRLLWILIRNLLLNALTLGFFRFWAKTHLRRFFWRHTKLLGEPLEYTGTGGELFIGFLIVMAVLVPLLGGASLLQFLVPHFAIQLLAPAVLIALTPIAIFRMWRYRFTRTLWRGVRFGLDGSSLRYAGLWLGYGAATILTLGLANPWRRIATTRYLVNHARFGATELSLDVRGGRMLVPWLAVIGPLAAIVAVLAATNASTVIEAATAFRDAHGAGNAVPGSKIEEILGRLHFWPLLFLIVPVIAYARYHAVEFRYLLDNVRAGDVRLRSSLGTAFYVVVHVLGGALVLAVVFGLPGLFLYGLTIADVTSDVAQGAMIVFGVIWVLLILVVNLAYILIVHVTILGHVCRTLAIENPASLDDIVQSSAALPRRGEGLADALDLGGF